MCSKTLPVEVGLASLTPEGIPSSDDAGLHFLGGGGGISGSVSSADGSIENNDIQHRNMYIKCILPCRQ